MENPSKGAREGFIIGSESFTDWVQTTILAKRKEEKEIPQLKRLMPKPAIDHIIESVSHEFGCSKEDVLRRGKKNNRARDIAIYFARSASGMTCKGLGEYFGGISGAGNTMKYNQMKKTLDQDKKFGKKIGKIKRKLNI